MKSSHFAVLNKLDYNKVLGNIERRALQEKIQFLRSIPIFSKLTKTSLGKMSYFFVPKKLIKNQVLYREN
jgi:MinD superfamily P-loop ATPase